LFLPTVEPEVAERRVRDALIEQGLEDMPFGTWKITTGLMLGGVSPEIKPVKRVDDLYEALVYVEASDKPVVLLVYNARHHIVEPQIQQALIDAILSARLKGSHIILIGSHLELPPELRPLVTWVDCPLPTRDAIIEQYRKIVQAYKKDIQLPKLKEEREALLRDAATAAVGMDMMGAENAIALSLASKECIDLSILQSQKEQEVRKSDVLEFVRVDESMDDVGGFSEFKIHLAARKAVFSEEARVYGLPYPKGYLIVGPAGSGKSLAAKAVAHYLKLPLLRLDMGRIFRSLMGESEAAIRLGLQVAEAVSPCVLWIDEIDKGFAGMAGSGELDSGVTARVVSTILTWRQETIYPVVLMATANNVATIPSMVYRKGRLDEVWATDLPTEAERDEIFRIHIRKRNRDPEAYNTAVLAARTENYVGAEIEGVLEDAMFKAFNQDMEFEDGHILESIRETVPQAQRDREEIAAIREWVKTRARHVSKEGEARAQKAVVRPIRSKKKGV
jgi:SpoVK/Ycf46/Vps4 family AAA+-type ATPase